MCEQCKAAQQWWDWDGYSEDCPGCTVRMVAKAGPAFRDNLLTSVIAPETPDERVSIFIAVSAEVRRLAALKAASPERWWQKQA